MRIFGKKRIPKIEDPAFGPIAFERGLWGFVPEAGAAGFMITIAAPLNGPSEAQRAYFREIRSSLAELQRRAFTFVTEKVGDSKDLGQLSIYAICLGTEEECRRGEFAMEFSDTEAESILHVSFHAHEPMAYGWDD